MKKIFIFVIFIVQLMGFPFDIFGSETSENETKTYIEYASGWTGSGIADSINAKLDSLQINTEVENKFLNIKDIKITITPEWGYAFIIYEISNKMIGTSPVSSHVQYASGWTGSDLASDISAKLDWLQRNAEKENKFINIKDIKITISPEWSYAFIIYEHSKSSQVLE